MSEGVLAHGSIAGGLHQGAVASGAVVGRYPVVYANGLGVVSPLDGL